MACEAQSRATWVLDLLTSLNVDKESFRIILMEMRSERFSLLDKLSACMVLARFWTLKKNNGVNSTDTCVAHTPIWSSSPLIVAGKYTNLSGTVSTLEDMDGQASHQCWEDLVKFFEVLQSVEH